MAAIMGLIFMYTFALSLCLNYANELQEVDSGSSVAQVSTVMRVDKYFNKMSDAMKWIFLATSGGVDWNDIYQEVENFSQSYRLSFLAFMYFYFLAVLNIIAAVFVAQAFRAITN